MPDQSQHEGRSARDTAADAFLSRIDSLLPEIRARAGETERLGRVPEDLIRALTDIGVFRAEIGRAHV